MAWQVKTRYTGAPASESVLKDNDNTNGTELQSLFNQYKQDGYILKQERETIDDNTKVDTIVFLSESKYNEYREAVINAIGNDETKYSNHTVEVIEQKEVAF